MNLFDEIQQAEVDIDQHCIACEMLESACVGLERIATTLESLEQPLNPQSAEFLGLALEAHMAPIGAPYAEPKPTLFDSPRKAQLATAVSLESVKEGLAKIIATIKTAAIRAWEAIRAFFQKLFGAAKKLGEKAQAGIEKARAAISGKATAEPATGDNGTIDLGEIAAKIAIGHKVDDLSATTVNHLLEICIEYASQADIAGEFTLQAMTAYFEGAGDARAARAAGGKLEQAYKTMMRGHKEEDGYHVSDTHPLPGNVKIVSHMPKEGGYQWSSDELAKVMRYLDPLCGYNIKLETTNHGDVAKTVKRCSPQEVEQIGRAVFQLAQRVQQHDTSVDSHEKSVRACIAAADKFAHDSQPKDGFSKPSDLTHTLRQMSKASRNCVSPTVKISHYLLRTGNAFMDAALKCLPEGQTDLTHAADQAAPADAQPEQQKAA